MSEINWICKRTGEENIGNYRCVNPNCTHTALHNPVVSKYTFSKDSKGVKSKHLNLMDKAQKKKYPYTQYLKEYA